MILLAQTTPTPPLPADWPQGELRPAKDAVDLPAAPAPAPLWPWALAAALLLAVLIGWLRRKFARPRPQPATAPLNLAETIADLRVRGPDLADAAFAQTLTDALRRELEVHSGQPLQSRTTAELLPRLPPAWAASATPLLRELDQARFAAAALSPAVRDDLLTRAATLAQTLAAAGNSPADPLHPPALPPSSAAAAPSTTASVPASTPTSPPATASSPAAPPPLPSPPVS